VRNRLKDDGFHVLSSPSAAKQPLMGTQKTRPVRNEGWRATSRQSGSTEWEPGRQGGNSERRQPRSAIMAIATTTAPTSVSHNPTTRESTRYYSLDLWRGFACLLVVVFHSTTYLPTESGAIPESITFLLQKLWLGVPMFFVISGYCISATADNTRLKSRPVTTYFKRRFRRIVPPFWIFLILWIACVVISDSYYPQLFRDNRPTIPTAPDFTMWHWLGNITLTESWRHLVAGGQRRYFVAHAWTLCYEEQFYAVTGLLLVLCPRRFFTGAATVTALTMGVTVATLTWGWSADGLFLDGYWLVFATGILVYYKINYCRKTWANLINLIFALGIGLSVAGLCLAPGSTLLQSMFIGFLFALALSLTHRWDSALFSRWYMRPILYCGVMCYSLYLVHFPITKSLSHLLSVFGVRSLPMTMLVTVPVCTAASIAVGWLFHTKVEQKFLNRPTVLSVQKQALRAQEEVSRVIA